MGQKAFPKSFSKSLQKKSLWEISADSVHLGVNFHREGKLDQKKSRGREALAYFAPFHFRPGRLKDRRPHARGPSLNDVQNIFQILYPLPVAQYRIHTTSLAIHPLLGQPSLPPSKCGVGRTLLMDRPASIPHRRKTMKRRSRLMSGMPIWRGSRRNSQTTTNWAEAARRRRASWTSCWTGAAWRRCSRCPWSSPGCLSVSRSWLN